MRASQDLDIDLGSAVLARDVFTSEFAPAFAVSKPDQPLADMPPHAHDFIEILVVESGHGLHLDAQGTVVLEPGSVVVVRPGAWHAFSDVQDLQVAMICISLSSLSTDLAFLRSRPATRDLLYAEPLRGKALGTWATQISPSLAARAVDEIRGLELQLQSEPDYLVLLGHLIVVLGTITSGLQASGDREASHPAVVSVLRHLEAEPERAWSLADLAAAVNLDAAYVCRLFGADLGVPPMAYLARLRAEKAANLLTETDEAVSLVGARVGWPDPTYFARRFRALIGLTPTEYRHQMQSRSVQENSKPS